MATGGSGSDTECIGWLFYEEKGLNEYVAIFAVTKDDDTLFDYIERKHPRAKICQRINFNFVQQDSALTLRGDFIELKFDTQQDEPTTGWSIVPLTEPCIIYRNDVDKFGKPWNSHPPSCRVSVRASSNAVPILRYTIPVEGATDPVTLIIERSLKGPVLGMRDLDYILDLLHKAGFSQMKWKPLGLALGLYHPTLKTIEAEYLRDVQECLEQCLWKWLKEVDGVNATGRPTMASLYDALEKIDEKAAADYIRKNEDIVDNPELCHYREALKTFITCHLTKVVVQGEARVGKTSFKSLLLDEKYFKVSTGIAEPRVGIYCYRRDTGQRYKLLNVTELEGLVKNALKKDALERSISSSAENQVSECIDRKKTSLAGSESSDLGSETVDNGDDGFVEGNEAIDGSSNEEETPGDGDKASSNGNEAPGDGNKSLLSKAVEKVLKEVNQCSGEENCLEGAQWLYLIDTGGQIAFQKLLPIFMPFSQVLILVVKLSKELCCESTAVMHCEGEDHNDGSPYRLTVEEVLKQIVSSIASGMQHFRESYKDHEVLRDLVPEKLQILTIGTHGDECSDVAQSKRILAEKLAEIIKGNDDCESIEDHHVVHVHEVDGRIANVAVEERGNNENCKSTKSSLDDIDEILMKDDKGINIPFYYYFFDIVLRVAAIKEGCGVLQLSTCISLGEDLKLSEDEVLESLNFLHHINSIIYYGNSEACSDLVFVNIGSLIGILKELVGHVHIIHSNKRVYAGDEDVIEGMLSESKFKQICKNQLDCIEKELQVDNIATKLLKLFLELSIATLIKDKYFIPALLPVRDVTDINPYKNREPLLFYFKKATPMGLFCSVITHLLSNFSYKIASTDSNFSNCMELKYHTEGVASFFVVLIEQINCIEVHCEEERGQDIVRENVEKAITSAAEKHNLSASHEIRFYCPCKRGPGSAGSDRSGDGAASNIGAVLKEKKHTVEVETVNKEHIFRCSDNPHTKCEDKKELWSSWLDAGIPNTPISNDELISPMILSTIEKSVSETGSSGSLQLQEVKDPMEILQKYSAKLTKAISANVSDVTKALLSDDLIPKGTINYIMTTVGVSTTDKADRVMTDVMGQLEASLDERQYLTDVCRILIKQGAAMKKIGNVVLKKLECCPSSC
ncbi:PREDICTED: uncharacterized protein LOC100636968 [Amphimedon queenslandica]|uniref:Death domain-containing protein n=1 Tax=Amphimedon queenslandica TaxID=400682 RepID=A0AAN0IHQ6_AMPQE|nr:PREDICTED: uncharacterized protein LOC100636968 [Amphimedon queenslandica]|eukprot:XP_003389245.2 PREDICTED: uncharacterized protein LOC100636968 [Amphimedon queenslandica]